VSEESLQDNRRRAFSLPWEVVLLLAWVVASQFSPASVDSVRDIYQAHSIVTGSALPLVGPQLAHTVHVGPLWFYILAVPAALFHAWGGIALVVFMISALKYWLAYILGRELHSAQFGLLFALFLALPGWSSTQLIIWTHTSVLETTLLLYLLSLRRSYFRPSSWQWLLTGCQQDKVFERLWPDFRRSLGGIESFPPVEKKGGDCPCDARQQLAGRNADHGPQCMIHVQVHQP
jgi:hypothetical protein